ncbi:MAG: hypothetical protein AAB656_03455 [Patescibacteria group bacterium]
MRFHTKFLIFLIPILFLGLFFLFLQPVCIRTFSKLEYLECLANKQDEMGWGNDVSKGIEEMKGKTTNKNLLMNQMINSKNGSIAAEGMIFAYEMQTGEFLENTIKIFKEDDRWNYWLTNNKQLYKITLLADKIRANKPLSKEEKELVVGWNNVLENTYKVNIPNNN